MRIPTLWAKNTLMETGISVVLTRISSGMLTRHPPCERPRQKILRLFISPPRQCHWDVDTHAYPPARYDVTHMRNGVWLTILESQPSTKCQCQARSGSNQVTHLAKQKFNITIMYFVFVLKCMSVYISL